MKTEKIKPFLNWKAITLLMSSMFSFAASVGLAIHSMSTRDITFSILGSVALGAGLLMGLLGALWWMVDDNYLGRLTTTMLAG